GQRADGQGAGRQGLQVSVHVRAQRRPLRPRREAADAAAGAGVVVARVRAVGFVGDRTQRTQTTQSKTDPGHEPLVSFVSFVLSQPGASAVAFNRRLNARIVAPAATPMYCVPSIAYVIGPARQLWLVLKSHNGFPVLASTALNPPAPSP